MFVGMGVGWQAASAEKGMTWEAEANKLRVTEQLLLEETRAKDNFKAELQATLNKLGESQLDFTNRLAAKEKQLVEFEASVADKMNTVSMLERDVRLLERDVRLPPPPFLPSTACSLKRA